MKLTHEFRCDTDQVVSTIATRAPPHLVAIPWRCRSQRGQAASAVDIIALFPKEVGEFAYADPEKGAHVEMVSAITGTDAPDRFRQFEKFLPRRELIPNTQVDELAWGLVAEGLSAKSEGKASTNVPTGEEIVGVALGTYNPNSTESVFQATEASTFKSRGYTLYAFGTGSGANDLFFFFIDSNTAAFGHRACFSKR